MLVHRVGLLQLLVGEVVRLEQSQYTATVRSKVAPHGDVVEDLLVRSEEGLQARYATKGRLVQDRQQWLREGIERYHEGQIATYAYNVKQLKCTTCRFQKA